MKVLRPDPRTGVVKVSQNNSRPTVVPVARQLQEEVFLAEDVGNIETVFIEPVIIVITEEEEKQPLIQQVKVTSPPKTKKSRRRRNKN